MEDSNEPSGPDPDSLEAVEHYPAEATPIGGMSITYTTTSLSDYVRVHKSEGEISLRLADPLFGIVRKASELKNLKEELAAAIAALELEGLVSHFISKVSEYVSSLLPSYPLPEVMGLSAAAYLLKKLHDTGRLGVGYIHQAGIDELTQWTEMIENAKQDPDITVTSGEDVL